MERVLQNFSNTRNKSVSPSIKKVHQKVMIDTLDAPAFYKAKLYLAITR